MTEDTVSIKVDPSAKTQIKSPEYLLQYDKVYMKNGDIFLITKAAKDQIEMMMVNRVLLPKEHVNEFMKKLDYVERSECFEKG